MKPKRSEAISNLLRARTHADLAMLYNADMEVQVNVGEDGGDRVDGDFKGKIWHGYTNGVDTWKPFRMPLDAKTDPKENDYPVSYDLALHAEGIGMTGWDWRNKLSRWVAFDFDAITGHSERHAKKLTEAELAEIQDVVSNIPWVTVRKSTSGNGLHLYVFLDPVRTENHTEHAAIARAILGLMASLTGFDFQSRVDACGGNMWVWHRKMQGTPGLSLIKEGIRLVEIPGNWKDHLNVVSNRAKKTVPGFIQDQGTTDDIQRLFDELTGQKTKIPLDPEHQKLINFLHDTGAQSWWDQDQHMLVTHTKFLKEAHEKLGLKGLFRTNSPGTENEQNCFCFPMRRGGWIVRRFTPGVAEASTWSQDSNGWTKCFYNQEPDLSTAAKAFGGIEHKNGGFVFREVEVALKSAQMIGVNPSLPSWIMQRKAKIKQHKDGRLIFEIPHEDTDRADDMSGWHPEKGTWSRIYDRKADSSILEPEVGNYDDMVRHLITETNEDYGWLIKSDRQWRVEPLVHVKTFFKSLNLKQGEVDVVLGSCIAKPWKMVCRPFQPEILGDREWNRNSPQLTYPPSNSDSLNYPTWLGILNHCGRGLDDAIKNNAWAKTNGILNGADYLKCWIASLFKDPLEPLPYLFFYGPQNSGKSILHEALSLLITTGVVRADHALMNATGFNGELESAVLCVIEETDMSGKNKLAYNRIKDWVTSPRLTVRHMFRAPFSVPNTTHYIQCANEPKNCPIFPGDSRITMVYVEPLDPLKLIPKKQLIPMLIKEAPDFLAAVLAVEIPNSGDRLNVPVIETQEKKIAGRANQTALESFIEDNCHMINGKIMLFSEFHERFVENLPPNEISEWSKIKTARNLPPHYPTGRHRATNQKLIGNISWVPKKEDEPELPRLTSKDDHLEPVHDYSKPN